MNSARNLKAVAAALLLAAAAGALIAGCDIPTAAPILEQRWALTAAQTALGVEELLPDGQISLAAGSEANGGSRLARASDAGEGSAGSCGQAGVAGEVVSGEGSITVSAEPICVAWTLEELCPDCRVGQPPAAMDTERQQSWTLPQQVVSVDVSGGTVVLTLDHDLDFTPLRAGELEIVVQSTGATQDAELLRWELDRDLAPGTPVTHTFDFSRHPVTVRGGVRLAFAIATEPDAGAPPVTDLTRAIRARAHVQSLTIDSARVRVDERIDGGEEFDLGEQDELDELIERFQQGSVIVTIDNQFPVRVSGTVTLGDTTTMIDIAPEGTTEVPFSYTRAELQELLSGPVTYAWDATVTSDGEQTVAADMQLLIMVRIDITLRTEAEQ